MKVYNFKNATFYVHGSISKECLEKATIKLIKDSHKFKRAKEARQ